MSEKPQKSDASDYSKTLYLPQTILSTVGADPEYPDVSPRDAQALREWKALAR